VEIINPEGSKEKGYKGQTKKNELLAVKTFTGSGATMIIMLKRIQKEIFKHLGNANNLGG
jgi:hypothetical protein